eukprot:518933-Karenia_brevis.AAC.1
MKRGKTCADDGLVAEMLKESSDKLLTCIAELFKDILTGHGSPPDTWKKTRLIVLFKKGDALLPKNYRPISILPVMCKLFSA